MKRLITGLVACVLAVGLVPSVASAAKGKGDVFQVNPEGVPMVPGQSGWTGVIWRAGDDDLTGFSATVEAPAGWGVTYPENRSTDTSLWDNDTLSADEVDFTAFRLTVPENTTAPSSHSVEVSLNYSYLKNGKHEKVVNKRFTLAVPVVAPSDPAFNQLTTSLGQFSPDSQTWVDMSNEGRATAFDFRLTVTDPAGATITYPNDGTSTSLNGDSVLEVGETDRASFRLDTSGLVPGTYTMNTNVSHRVATQTRNTPGTVSFEVVPGSPAPARAGSNGAARVASSSHASLVEVEARRLCDVAKMSFYSPSAMGNQLAQRVTDAGHSLETYEAWRDRLSKRPVRRAKVYRMYRSLCGVQNPRDDPNSPS